MNCPVTRVNQAPSASRNGRGAATKLPPNRAFVIIDLGFGDSGKGTIVDWLVREYEANEVVRFNGGGQAGHNVVTEDGRWHEFSQFGAGMFVPGVRTHLNNLVIVNPATMLNEELHLREIGILDAFERTTIDAGALITTPFHVAANRIRELARNHQHGSVGLGVGETRADALHGHALYAKDLYSPDLEDHLRWIQQRKWEEVRHLQRPYNDRNETAKLMTHQAVREAVEQCRELATRVRIEDNHRIEGTIVFEGAQGILLDERYGFHPYTTWSNCTSSGLLYPRFDIKVIGVCRAYMTRHGPGPFPTEANLDLPDQYNTFDKWQRDFRVGYTDLLSLRYALAVQGIDALAVTNMDRILDIDPWKVASAYAHGDTVMNQIPFEVWPSLWRQQRLGELLERVEPIYDTYHPHEVPELLARALGVPLMVTSYGPTAADKQAIAPAILA